jgi:hypothetical protein
VCVFLCAYGNNCRPWLRGDHCAVGGFKPPCGKGVPSFIVRRTGYAPLRCLPTGASLPVRLLSRNSPPAHAAAVVRRSRACCTGINRGRHKHGSGHTQRNERSLGGRMAIVRRYVGRADRRSLSLSVANRVPLSLFAVCLFSFLSMCVLLPVLRLRCQQLRGRCAYEHRWSQPFEQEGQHEPCG